ncbi:MAG: type II secretion system F family protein [Candidatus Aenigmarchaeota archaeon]|nr:type II secretion system F family protein [Candidatus Aenigmarchaeota archaeon]
MNKKIPFLPMPYKHVKKATNHFLGIGESLSKIFPDLDFDLQQSGFEISARRWMAIGVFAFMFYFFVIFIALFVVTVAAKIEIIRALGVSVLAGLGLGCGSFMFLSFYPKLTAQKKVKSVEKNLPYVLHHILVEVRAGVPLYDTLVSIAKGNYGILSKEMRRVVNEINTGKSEAEALEKITRETPSFYFRRVMWQMINALKSGADIGATMKEIVDNLAIEQRVAIKKYGSQLNPLALIYMLFAVIFPTLGITFLLILTSFTGIGFQLELVLGGILGVVILFQVMFIGLIKSRRPAGID